MAQTSISKTTINLKGIAGKHSFPSADMMDQGKSSDAEPNIAQKNVLTYLRVNLRSYCGTRKVRQSTECEGFPLGNLNTTGSRREFTLAEARSWIRTYRKDKLKPAGAEAVTIAVSNFKGS